MHKLIDVIGTCLCLGLITVLFVISPAHAIDAKNAALTLRQVTLERASGLVAQIGYLHITQNQTIEARDVVFTQKHSSGNVTGKMMTFASEKNSPWYVFTDFEAMQQNQTIFITQGRYRNQDGQQIIATPMRYMSERLDLEATQAIWSIDREEFIFEQGVKGTLWPSF